MATSRARALFLIAAASAVAVALLSPAAAQATTARPGLLVVAMPRSEAQLFLYTGSSGVGLGVFPDSRDPARFIAEIGYGAPIGRGSEAELGGRAGELGRAFRSAGRSVAVANNGPFAIRAALASALSPDPRRPLTVSRDQALAANVAGLWVDTKNEIDEIVKRYDPHTLIVIGIGERTPVLIGVDTGASRSYPGPGEGGWLLTNGIARRPGIVTPYDLAAMMLTGSDVAVPTDFDLPVERGQLHVPGGGFIGKPMRFDVPSDPNQPSGIPDLLRIEERMVRDAEIGHAVGGVTVPMSIAAAMLGVALVRFGRNRWAIRAGLASWAANVGYIVALFVPAGSGITRALIMLGVMAAAAALLVRGSPKLAARYAFATTAAFWLAALLAPLRPGGLPGAAIWGNPLISWRFFGLQNFEAGLVACGVVVWGVIAGFGPRVLAVLAVLAGVVIAAPTIGANYVGLLTFAFGAALAVLALVRKRVEIWHVFAAGTIASVGFVASLIADTGSPVSHGGRAAERISQGGLSVFWEFVRRRMRLNLDLIRTFPLETGFVLMAAMVIAIVMLFRWSLKRGQRWPGAVAVWGGAAMALASMTLEDSGFYSGAVIFVIAAAGYIVASGEAATISPPSPAPPDAAG